jgi:hypothetical protein
MTLRQPTERHSGNARFDEEVPVVVPDKKDNTRQPIVFDVPADATDEELDALAIVVVAELDAQAAEHHREDAEAARWGVE